MGASAAGTFPLILIGNIASEKMAAQSAPETAAPEVMRRSLWSVGMLVVLASGCGGPSRIDAPDWEPEGMADAAMELNDKNGDGVLDKQELAAAPGLQAAAVAEGGSADGSGDGKLSRDEIRNRIAYYQQTMQGLQRPGFEVHLGGQRLAGASVEMTPEPFLAGVLKPARGTTREDGWVLPAAEGFDVPGVQPGMYRVVVTGPADIPAKYTSADTTPWGVEITVPQVGYGAPIPPFNIEK
jgi:hypothetical protein